MSDPINNDGPAFPLNIENNGDANIVAFGHVVEPGFCLQFGGMTLRDYFAAKAMQALVSCDDYDNTCPGYAKMAYDMADAMLKARGN